MAHEFKPLLIPKFTKQYGFVVDHRAYWGIPIPGYDREPQPRNVPPTGAVPSFAYIHHITVETEGWTGGEFKLLATRTPPLFHALHHKTDKDQPMHEQFERRAEKNLIETSEFDRKPLKGKGQEACVEICKFEQEGGHGQWVANPTDCDVPFSDFDTGNHETGLVKKFLDQKYFEIRQGIPRVDDDGPGWNVSKVGPLNALWFIILQKDLDNTPLDRLGEGYRLWHHLDHHNEEDFTNGYRWHIDRDEDFRTFLFWITLSGKLNSHRRGVRCPDEEIKIHFDLEWPR